MKWRRPSVIIPVVVLVVFGPLVFMRSCSEKPQQTEVEQLLAQIAEHSRENLPKLNAVATQPDREQVLHGAQAEFNAEQASMLEAVAFVSVPAEIEEARRRWAQSLRKQAAIWEAAAEDGRPLTDAERSTLEQEFKVSGEAWGALAKYAAPRRRLF